MVDNKDGGQSNIALPISDYEGGKARGGKKSVAKHEGRAKAPELHWYRRKASQTCV